jgi:hypothetical protein
MYQVLTRHAIATNPPSATKGPEYRPKMMWFMSHPYRKPSRACQMEDIRAKERRPSARFFRPEDASTGIIYYHAI